MFLQSRLSVSYTHLDVYKRQALHGKYSRQFSGDGVGNVSRTRAHELLIVHLRDGPYHTFLALRTVAHHDNLFEGFVFRHQRYADRLLGTYQHFLAFVAYIAENLSLIHI